MHLLHIYICMYNYLFLKKKINNFLEFLEMGVFFLVKLTTLKIGNFFFIIL